MKKSNLTLAVLNLGLLFTAVTILFFLLIFPTRYFAGIVPFDVAPFQKFQGLAIFCFICLGLILLALKSWWNSYTKTINALIPPSPPRTQFGDFPNGKRPWWAALNALTSIAIILGAVYAIDTPLDIDENIHALMMTRRLYSDELDPIKSDPRIYFTQNHVLAQAASILSMEAFGYEKIPYRSPAIVFTVLLLLIVPIASRSLFPTPGYFLVLGFLASNAFSLWYLHSARGYVSLLGITALSYFLAVGVLEGRSGRRYYGAYVLSLFLSPFTHFFSMIFHLLLSITLVFWSSVNRQSLSREKSRAIFRLLLAQALALPLFCFVLARNLTFLSRIGDFEKSSGESNLWMNITKAFGIAFDWQARAFLLFSFSLVLWAIFHRREFFRRFSTLFVATCFLFFSLVLNLSDTKVFESRFVLAFVLPFAVWMIDSAFYLARGHYQRWGAALTLGLLLVIFPAVGHRAIYRTLTFNLQDFDDAMKTTATLTSPVEKGCYLFSGKRDLSIFAKDFYFRKAKQAAFATEGHPNCKVFYHLRLEPSLDGGPVELTTPFRAIELWNNHRGMALYLQTQSSFFAARD